MRWVRSSQLGLRGRKGRERASAGASSKLPKKVGCGECCATYRKFQNPGDVGLALSLISPKALGVTSSFLNLN